MSAKPETCPSCGAPMVPRADGNCSACGVDPFLVEVVGEKRAVADALARHLSDIHDFVERLAAMLEEGFAEHTEVRKAGVFTKHISEIEVTLAQHVYHLKVHGKHATGLRTRNVRGIKLKEEKLEMAAWLVALSEDLEKVASESRQAREALEKFIK